MALKEQDIVFTTTDEAGNTVIQFPITRVENVEDAVRTVNKKKPDSNGDIQIDVDMSHLATKDELTKGLANKRDHTIQIANADLNTLLEDKTWACSGTLKNTPIPCTFCIVQAYDTGAPVSGNIVQVCYIPNQTNNTVRAFWRNCLNGATFGAWSESGAVKTVNSIAPDASGEVTLPNATTSRFGLVRLAAEEDVLKESPQTAVCTQLIYEINEFRRKSTAYQVGEKVDCAFQYERFLECTKAGTTSADMLDTRNVTHGQVITDGTVEWTVRTHARSINGAVADANGNVVVSDGLKDVLTAANMAISNNLVNTGQVDLATVLNTVNALNAEYQRLKEMLNGAKFIIETGKSDNGNAWYRKWSDGWIEQGGYQPNTGNGNHFFDFPIPFKDMNYTVVATAEQPKNQADANAVIAKETTSRVYIVTQSYAYKTYLYACGY